MMLSLNKSETKKLKNKKRHCKRLRQQLLNLLLVGQLLEPIVTGVAAGEDIPIPIVGLDKLDADQFLMPRFGLVNEFGNSMVDLN